MMAVLRDKQSGICMTGGAGDEGFRTNGAQVGGAIMGHADTINQSIKTQNQLCQKVTQEHAAQDP